VSCTTHASLFERLAVKRFCLYFFTALVAFIVGVLASLTNTYRALDQQIPKNTAMWPASHPQPLPCPCLLDTFVVKSQPESKAQLNIVEANCNGPVWNARLTLLNLGPKALTEYEVVNLDYYEHGKSVESFEGFITTTSRGPLVPPGATESLNFNGVLFHSGLSCRKPAASTRSHFFWIKHLEYIYGTSWWNTDQG
jgi:hypothetical protein